MRTWGVFCLLLVLLGCGGGAVPKGVVAAEPFPAGEYQNPVRIRVPDGSLAESCPDPAIIRGQTAGDDYWYLYCTSERFKDDGPVHLIAISRSKDLVNWQYAGDAFATRPAWVANDGWLWAPDIQYFNGKYYLYYTASATKSGGSAIFVATSDSPLGPWTAYSVPVIEPSISICCRGGYRWTIDSNVLEDAGLRYIVFGSFNGGLSVRVLSADGLSTDKATEVQISPPDRYEASYILKHDGYFYMFASAGDCCAGAMSGYAVYAGRALHPLGPYEDKDGRSLADIRVGGTPVLAMNGNRWIGPGHNAVITDDAGQDWMVYHAIDVDKPTFKGSWTRRPVLIDPIDWIDGWPRVRGGSGPSETMQAAPIVTPGTPVQRVSPVLAVEMPGVSRPDLSDDFDASVLQPQWSWIRQPGESQVGLGSGKFRMESQAGALYVGRADGTVLVEPQPSGEYIVETKLSWDVPLAGSFNFVQAGIVIYADDNNYVKLVTVAINSTRQIEFGKQIGAKPPGSSAYGSTFLASPSDDTYLRVVKRVNPSGEEVYTAYSSHDGLSWERGGTWTHKLGPNARIGIVSMGVAGFNSYFDYVRVSTLQR